jgi:hypothetical protein
MKEGDARIPDPRDPTPIAKRPPLRFPVGSRVACLMKYPGDKDDEDTQIFAPGTVVAVETSGVASSQARAVPGAARCVGHYQGTRRAAAREASSTARATRWGCTRSTRWMQLTHSLKKPGVNR